MTIDILIALWNISDNPFYAVIYIKSRDELCFLCILREFHRNTIVYDMNFKGSSHNYNKFSRADINKIILIMFLSHLNLKEGVTVAINAPSPLQKRRIFFSFLFQVA